MRREVCHETKAQTIMEPGLDLEAESDRRVILFYREELEAGDLAKIPPSYRRKLRRIGALIFKDPRGWEVTPLTRAVLRREP